MINKFIELAKISDLKIIQEEAKDLSIKSIDDVKTYFVNKNIEISDKLANELLDRIDTKEISIDELSTISAGTKYYGATQDKCPICGNETYTEWINDDEGIIHRAIACPEGRQSTICSVPYEEWVCNKCGAEFTYWVNEGYAED